MGKNRLLVTVRFTFIIFSGFIVGSGIIMFIITFLWAIGVNIYRLRPISFSFITLFSCFILSAIFTAFRTRNYVKVLSELERTLKNVKNGKYESQMLTETGNIELQEIVDTVNLIIKEMNSNVLLKKDFVRNFSHEFKTPIASIHGFAEILCTKKDLTEEEKMGYYSIIKDESARLSNLANNSLFLSKLDSDSFVINKEQLYVDEQIEECLVLFADTAEKKNISVDVDLDHFEFYGSKELLKELFINIISNSMKYTLDNGKFSVYSEVNKDEAIVTFKDNGIGMNEEVKSHIFDEYYQGNTSMKNNGMGLGMAIVKKICNLHKIKIKVESKENEGTEIMLKFQVYQK